MKKFMFLVVVLMVSAIYTLSYAAGANNSVTLDANVGSLFGGSVTGEFGLPLNLSGGAAYSAVGEGGTFFVNSNYSMELSKDYKGSIGAGYRFLDDTDDGNTHIGEAILGVSTPLDKLLGLSKQWTGGLKTHLGAGAGFRWEAYAAIGYIFAI